MAEAQKNGGNPETKLVKNEQESRLTQKAPVREPGLSHKKTMNFLSEKRLERKEQEILDRAKTLKSASPKNI